MLPVSSGVPYPELGAHEISRMVITAAIDEGLAAAGRTINKYGGLRCAALSTDLKSMLGHLLTRPEPIRRRIASWCFTRVTSHLLCSQWQHREGLLNG